jgi:endonuclease III
MGDLKEITIQFKVNEEKAIEIAEKLLDFFYRQKRRVEGYQAELPSNLDRESKEHALYLTYVISVDYMTDADKLWKKSRKAYESKPEKFRPEVILNLGNRILQRFVRDIGARFPSNGAKTWKTISRILLEKYDGDPRNITRRPLSIGEIKDKLKEFPYLKGGKLSNFYIRAMGENKLFKITNFDEHDISVDQQVARFTVYTGVLQLISDRFEGCVHKDPFKDLIENAWRKAAKANNIPPWKLDEPIWAIGSKLCSKRKCSKCPVEEFCNKTRGIRFKENIIVWEKRRR